MAPNTECVVAHPFLYTRTKTEDYAWCVPHGSVLGVKFQTWLTATVQDTHLAAAMSPPRWLAYFGPVEKIEGEWCLILARRVGRSDEFHRGIHERFGYTFQPSSTLTYGCLSALVPSALAFADDVAGEREPLHRQSLIPDLLLDVGGPMKDNGGVKIVPGESIQTALVGARVDAQNSSGSQRTERPLNTDSVVPPGMNTPEVFGRMLESYDEQFEALDLLWEHFFVAADKSRLTATPIIGSPMLITSAASLVPSSMKSMAWVNLRSRELLFDLTELVKKSTMADDQFVVSRQKWVKGGPTVAGLGGSKNSAEEMSQIESVTRAIANRTREMGGGAGLPVRKDTRSSNPISWMKDKFTRPPDDRHRIYLQTSRRLGLHLSLVMGGLPPLLAISWGNLLLECNYALDSSDADLIRELSRRMVHLENATIVALPSADNEWKRGMSAIVADVLVSLKAL